MALFTDTVTLYNHLPDDTWQRTVLEGVQYVGSVEKSVSGDGKIIRNTAVTVTIPESVKCNRVYMSARAFRKLTDHCEYWTLDAEKNLDVMVLGEVQAEITEEYRLKDLKDDYDCVTVSSVSDNRNRDLLKHIKVVCT